MHWLHHVWITIKCSRGVFLKDLWKLQLVQNAAACLLTIVRHGEHIMPLFHHQHCLPVCFQVQFKVLVLIFKAVMTWDHYTIFEELHPWGEAASFLKSMGFLACPATDRDALNIEAWGGGGKRHFAAVTHKLRNSLPLMLFQFHCSSGDSILPSEPKFMFILVYVTMFLHLLIMLFWFFFCHSAVECVYFLFLIDFYFSYSFLKIYCKLPWAAPSLAGKARTLYFW